MLHDCDRYLVNWMYSRGIVAGEGDFLGREFAGSVDRDHSSDGNAYRGADTIDESEHEDKTAIGLR